MVTEIHYAPYYYFYDGANGGVIGEGPTGAWMARP